MKDSKEPHFIDKEFGSYKNFNRYGGEFLYFDRKKPPMNLPEQEKVIWESCEEIAGKSTQFMPYEDDKAHKIVSGQIGDKWFIGALAALGRQKSGVMPNVILDEQRFDEVTPAEVATLTDGLLCPIFNHYHQWGLYVVRFYKNY